MQETTANQPIDAGAVRDYLKALQLRIVSELERIDGANPVVAALINARLLTLSDGRIELAHEALLHEWPRYHSWLDEDQAGRRLHTHLATAAAEWEAHRAAIVADLGPVGAMELALAELCAAKLWRLYRVSAYEAVLIANAQAAEPTRRIPHNPNTAATAISAPS